MREAEARYFERIETDLDAAIAVAERARERGGDPTPDVEIPVATDMADRVEKVLDIEGVADRVRELEDEYTREEAALALVEDFVDGTVGDFDTPAATIEGAVRTAVALLTEGVVAAPIEGIDRVELLENGDGTQFVNVYYAGPIRSAGGTAQALSVLAADYARALLDIDEYHARDAEVGRYAEEVALYDDEVGLQYEPTQAETAFIAEHLPIMLDGEPTGEREVSGHRDVERVDTNAPRGGMCLVMAEGIALKAPKIQRYTRDLEGVDWPWLDDLIHGEFGEGTEESSEDSPDTPENDAPDISGPPRVESSKKYLRDLIAGRPVFSHPSEPGGFRLRYGRARNHGFATAGVHPATMHLVEDFLAAGTQLKTELPGKAAGVVPVDSIEGPTVRLANGDVRRIDDPAEAREVRHGVEAVLDLGEYLVNYGEFVENNQRLAPAAYTVEWWVQEFAAAGGPVQALRDRTDIDLADPDTERVLAWATEYDAPLHPKATYLWHDVGVDDVLTLARAIDDVELVAADGATAGTDWADGDGTLAVPRRDGVRETLETLLVEHTQESETLVVSDWRPLVRTLGFVPTAAGTFDRDWTGTDLSTAAREYDDGENAIRAINEIAPFTVRERAPTRVGSRMGRPEKSEVRELSPAVHTLFPIGEAGGNQRSIEAAVGQGDDVDGTKGEITVEVGRRDCTDCGRRTFRPRCPDCGWTTRPVYLCPDCEHEVEPDQSDRAVCPRCETRARPTERTTIDLASEFSESLAAVNERPSSFEILKGVKGLTSHDKAPEPMAKGVLRAKHGVSTFKDGTVRYDMTDLPVTAVRPAELSVSVERFRELGYEEDVHGEPLEGADQLVELKVQDVILSEGAAEHLQRTADFVDDLLTEYYGMGAFYEVETREDLVGELVFGMAPHTSAAVVGRVVGFTSASVGYAHPYFHASKRRNCFHPDTEIWYREAGRWRYDSLRSLVEERLDDPSVDDFGTLVQELDGDLAVPSLTSSGRPIRQPVEAVSKHLAPDHLLRIKTKTGRELTVSPEHSMRRWNGEVERVAAQDLAPGDAVPMPKRVDVDGTAADIDLLASFVGSDRVPNGDLVVRGIGGEHLRSIFDEATEGPNYLQPVADALGVSDSTVDNWIRRDSVPVGALLDLVSANKLLTVVPDDVTLGVRRDSASVARHVTIDERLGRLLGYYAAEGFCRSESGLYSQTTICTPDDEVREFVRSTFAESLSVDAYPENEWKITVSSRLVAVLFADVLEMGTQAAEKGIPEPLLTAPSAVLSAFLSGYFDGGGSAATNRIEVRAHTVSDRLKDDLVAALKRFGVVPKVRRESRTPTSGALAEFYDEERTFESWTLKITSENAVRFAESVGFDRDRKRATLSDALENTSLRPQRLCSDGGEVWLDEVESVDVVRGDVDHLYSLTVAETNALVANDLFTGQCDGDEDCVMLLMDGLLNFSKSYLPSSRGGRMDAPLVMSSRIDPAEIDDEAHNVDVVEQYPLEFYEATRELAYPDTVDIDLAASTVDTDRAYTGFRHTHDTSDIAAGPALSAYKTLGSMEEKMDAQLALSRTIRAVDERNVAERLIEYHFLPDIAGNLRAFSSQETRCHDCNTKYRRPPLSYQCRECGGDVHLTVHEGSVTKYMDTALRVAEEFGAREYTKQRLEILQRSIERVFEDDQNKQSGIADFM